MGGYYIAKAFITVISGRATAAARHRDGLGIVRRHRRHRVLSHQFGAGRDRRAACRDRAAAAAAARDHRSPSGARGVAHGRHDADAALPRWWWWAGVIAVTIVLMILPSYLRISQINGISKLFPLGLLAVSMGFMWGFAGMLSFGQTAFFGLGGYVYAVLALYSGRHRLAA